MQRGAVAGAFRTIPFKILTFAELGLPPIVQELSKRPRGLMLVTGPTCLRRPWRSEPSNPMSDGEGELRVFLTSAQKNEGKFPILAGPMELLLQNGFVGWTRVLFVAPGEEFRLSFGPDATLRLARTEKERLQDATSTDWKTLTKTVWIYLSSLGDEAKTVELIERMPVSEFEQVKITLGAKRPPLCPQAEGR